jgi:hypothetical protein
MTKYDVTTKAELLTSIEHARTNLVKALEQLTNQQMTTIQDAQGWTVKDHLAHISSWERSVVFFLRGKPRSAGLGVDPALYMHGSADEVNAAMFQQSKAIPLETVLAEFHAVHQELLQLLQTLTDIDLQKKYREYLPEELGDDRTAMEVIYGNTTGHFGEHLGWIEEMIGKVS